MRDYHSMKQSMHGDGPLSKEIIIFKKKREQADMIEQIFRNIRNNYAASEITPMKENLDGLLSQHTAYNKPVGAAYLNKLKNELASRAFQAPEFAQSGIINDFKLKNSAPAKVAVKQNPPTVLPAAQDRPTQGAGRATPSRIDRGGNQVEAPRQVTFDPQVTGEAAAILPRSSSTGQLKPGKPSAAKISPDRLEAQLSYSLKSPQFTHTKTINLSNFGAIPVALRSMDDRNLAVGFADGTLKILDLANTNIARQFKFSSKVTAIESIEDDGKQRLDHGLLCGLGGPENLIVLVEAGKPDADFAKFIGHAGEVTCIVSAGGGRFISGSADGSIVLWKVGSQDPVHSIKAHSGSVNSLTLLNSNSLLVSAGEDRVIRSFGLGTGHFVPKNRIQEASQISAVHSFHGNSRFIFSCLANGLIKIWNVESGR